MFCPSCGGEIAVDKRFARLVVCTFCDSAVLVDEKAARVAGKMSVLPSPDSPLFVGATGTLLDRFFRILGRVRYGYSRGYWDEWYLVYDDDETAWISEDEGNFSLEAVEQVEQLSLDYATTSPGGTVQLGDTLYHVDEKDVAACEGGQGQLPFAIMSGEKVPFLDLSAGKAFATVEFETDEDGGARVFRGRRLALADIQLDATAEEAGATGTPSAERAGREGKRERIVVSSDRAKDLKCCGCGGPLEIPTSGVTSITCEYCGNELDLSLRRVICPQCSSALPLHGGAEAKSVICRQCGSRLDVRRPEPTLLGPLLDADRPQIPFALGQVCQFEDSTYHLVGHLRFVQRDAWGVYRSDEFLLHSPDTGYRWLNLENGHFSMSVEIDDRPFGLNARTAIPKRTFQFLDRQWKVFENATHEIEWVDGELPWVAQVGDQASFMDAIAPPLLLSAEWTETELEWFCEEYLSREAVALAFDMPVTSLPRSIGVAPHQPYPAGPVRKQSVAVMAAFAAMFLTMAALAFMDRGTQIGKFSLAAEAYGEEFLTRPFVVTQSGAVCKASFESKVDQSWVYLEVAVINDRDEALLDFSAQMSYYSGYEGGESWSEGSRKDTVVFKLTDPGSYRLLVMGQAGAGDKQGSLSKYGRPVHIMVEEGVGVARYHLVLAFFCFAWSGIEWFRRLSFEKERWGDEDDDDD